MRASITTMTAADYDEVIDLWRRSPGIGLSAADERSAIHRYLQRNPGMSFTARDEGRLVGAVLCGHDGRRGYLHHLAVEPDARGRGIGRALAACCLVALRAEGIDKCHLFVKRTNDEAARFWQRVGWEERGDLWVYSIPTSG